MTPRIFEKLETTGRGAGGEIQLTDGIAALLAEEPVLAYEFMGRRYDCGSKLGYLQATVEYALNHFRVSAPNSKSIFSNSQRHDPSAPESRRELGDDADGRSMPGCRALRTAVILIMMSGGRSSPPLNLGIDSDLIRSCHDCGLHGIGCAFDGRGRADHGARGTLLNG